MSSLISVVVYGAAGYTGAELVRMLMSHPNVRIVALCADSNAGAYLHDLFPSFGFDGFADPMIRVGDVDFSSVDVLFSCLPHHTLHKLIADVPDHVRVIDLAADFRLKDSDVYESWYGPGHEAWHLVDKFVYGLSEYNRVSIMDARYVACPGCYASCVLLPLLPLVLGSAISLDGIIVDAKTGVSGAGRKAGSSSLFCEVYNSIRAYNVLAHRHIPEIEQELRIASGSSNFSLRQFTPTLIPVSRGMMASIYVNLASDLELDVRDVCNIISEFYCNSEFVFVSQDMSLTTKSVIYTNKCCIGIFPDRRGDGSLGINIFCVLDNLIKGASGQALQNFNLMFGFDESTALCYSRFPSSL